MNYSTDYLQIHKLVVQSISQRKYPVNASVRHTQQGGAKIGKHTST